ncbi:MAG: hypothetical protein K9L17_08335 [Clostridiales bacterium]|nr:hypothetical protein [Clostridiales bacterium]MCF8022683.1 hypothetical protein [Clostridiales bacterium]
MRGEENGENTGSFFNNDYSNSRFFFRLFKGKFMVLRNNEGFIDLYAFSIFFIILTICFATIAGIGFSGHRLAVMTYDWFESSMNFSSATASMYSRGTSLMINKPIARECFIKAFSRMTKTNYSNNAFTPKQNSPYPGKIILKRFEVVSGYKIKKPGYIAKIEVPVIGAKLPFIGYQSIKVPMRYYTVGRNIEI